MTTILFSAAISKIVTGRRFGVASSLNRHVQKCSQKAHPRMDVVREKVAMSQSTPTPAARDPSYEAARALEVRRSIFYAPFTPVLTLFQLATKHVPRMFKTASVS